MTYEILQNNKCRICKLHLPKQPKIQKLQENNNNQQYTCSEQFIYMLFKIRIIFGEEKNQIIFSKIVMIIIITDCM